MFGCIPLCCKSYGSTEDIVIQSHSEIKLQQFNITESHGLTEQAPVAWRAYEAIQQMSDSETYWAIHQTEIYSVDKIIQPSKHWGKFPNHYLL